MYIIIIIIDLLQTLLYYYNKFRVEAGTGHRQTSLLCISGTTHVIAEYLWRSQLKALN